MLSKKTKKTIALSMALTMTGGFAQSSSVLTVAYGEETNGQKASETLEDSFTEADESLKEKLDSELNDESTREDVQTILNDFEYVTSGAAVRITANNITDYKNDAESCSFKASLQGQGKNGEDYAPKGTKEFTYSKTKETLIMQTYNSSPAVSGEWITDFRLKNKGDKVDIINGNQIVTFQLLDAKNRKVSVLKQGITASNVELEIPKTITCAYTKYTVTEISESAFSNCDKLAKVTIPDSVEIIGKNAFRECKNITSLTLPKELNQIGYNAFALCINLTETNYPKISETTGDYIFKQCNKLETVKVEEGVTSIGNYAFYECTSLKNLILPGGLEIIGQSAFESCTDLELNLPESITTIGISAFYNCGLTSVTIPGSVGTISASAFKGCEKLGSVTVKEGVTEIENNAFWGCTALTIVKLPEGLTKIGEKAFLNNDLSIIILPETLTNIGASAFSNCNLTSVTIPEGVTTIGENAFSGSNLKYMNLPDGLSNTAGIPMYPTMLLISKDCNDDDNNPIHKYLKSEDLNYKILGLKLDKEIKEISSYKGSISYYGVLEPVGSAADVKVEIISENDDIAEAKYDKAENKVTISATGKGNGTVKVKIIAEETVGGETYNFYKIRQVKISNNVDRSLLTDKYNEANKLSKDNYTDKSFSELKGALSNVGLVINNGSTASEKDIENAYNALSNAIDNLVDINEIKKLYADVKDIAKGNYTDKTYNKFKTALKGAETIINKKDASKSEVDNALTELKEATEQLLGTDKTSLISLYNKYVAMKQGEYTDDSFNNFTVALSDAKSVIENGNATQSEITAAENKLQDAVSVLKVKNSSSGGSSSGSGSSGGSSSSSSSSGSSSSGSSSGSSSASEAKPVITVDGQEIKPVTLSKDTYGSSVIGNTLAPLGLNLSELNLLYEINSDKFKGNVAKLSKTIQNADGTKSETHYVYIKCEEGEKFKADVSNLNKDVPAYVYKIDNKGSVSLIQTLDSNTVKNNGYAVELNSEIGSTYVISEEKIDTASNTSAPSVTTGWNLIDGKWHEVLADGNYVKGWHKDTDGKWYMLDITTGVMVTGWFKDKDEKWYYLKESGAMATGWVKDIDGKWYYLYADGSMAADTTVDGYYLGKSGAWSN